MTGCVGTLGLLALVALAFLWLVPSREDRYGAALAPVAAQPAGTAPPAGVGMLGNYGGDLFKPSDVSQEYYDEMNPQGLRNLMPGSWRPGAKCSGAGDDGSVFDQFARYSISPDAVRRSEGLRGMLRLQENSRNSNSRTLGTANLLGNAVIPLNPIPIGSKSFVFQDSSQRQSYIAAATGSFPTQIGC